jgi:hypothetical protein
MNQKSHLLLFLVLFLASCTAINPAPDVSPTPLPSGTVLFQDDFSSNSSGWNRMLVNEGVMDYDAGGYRILVNVPQVNFWATPRKNFSDVRIEADMGKLAGPDENRIGLVCRVTGDNYYFFIISSDGFYGAGIFFSGQAILLGHAEMQASEHINKGLAVNHLRADCVGNTLTFYINGFEVIQLQDSTLASGDVGILAGTFDVTGTDIIFDNFVVLQP